MVRWIAHFLIAIGFAGWIFVIFGLEADAVKQMMAVGVLCLGVFMHHIWDELMRDKDA